ncbi:sugar phosphorylase [Rossellomorea sp. NS-SX7]|uniref:sugar phosphorylase n=1 Tax=Rossellomorea sp. NS-SX7 TaxID=3463856 RepID=UPI004059C454
MKTIEQKRKTILENLEFVYGKEKGEAIYEQVNSLVDRYKDKSLSLSKQWVDEKDIMVITYGDSIKEDGKAPLKSLKEFLTEHTEGKINSVHVLPFYPYSSDDGFSVIDYLKVNPDLGEWEDIHDLAEEFDIMFDAVINHISSQSDWFKEYKSGNPAYEHFFVEADPNEDYSTITRPRALPLLTKVETNRGEKYVWTTFSDDQIDLNYENEGLLLSILDILAEYVEHGARYLRLDAIGFMWKKLGTTSIHLEETHRLVQIMRDVLEIIAPGTIIITETNVPHKDNISYFGNGHNEAHLVYQFPLPPLTLQAFQTEDATHLSNWAGNLESTTEDTTFFNFLASHDGVGVRPVEGILSQEEVQAMVEKVKERGGYVSYKDNGDGTQSPYELNINYLDALSIPGESDEKKASRFLAAQSILLSMMGVPGIYIHSLLGSRNDHEGVKETGRYRSINRKKLNRSELEEEVLKEGSLRNLIFTDYKHSISVRTEEKAFHPNATQEVFFTDKRVLSMKRSNVQDNSEVTVLVNVSGDDVPVTITGLNQPGDRVKDLLTEQMFNKDNGTLTLTLSPYEVLWLKESNE